MPASSMVEANPGSSEAPFAPSRRPEDGVDNGEARPSRVRSADGSLPMLVAATCGLGVSSWAGPSVVGCATGVCPTGAAAGVVGATTGSLLGAGCWAGWLAGVTGAAGVRSAGVGIVGWGACSTGTGGVVVGGTGCWPGAICKPGGSCPGCWSRGSVSWPGGT
jgi:hypothetical protein